MTGILEILILGLFFSLASCAPGNTKDPIEKVNIDSAGVEQVEVHNKSIDLMQGLWYHDKDSLAFLIIDNNEWSFNYKGEPPNYYSISITDKLPEFVKETEQAEFIILTNQTDTMQFEIMGLTDSTFSMLYYPAGRIHLYKRQK